MAVIRKVLSWCERWLAPCAVLALVATIFTAVFWSYATWLPVRGFDVFLMVGMSICGIGVVWGYFKMYAIFDRMVGRK
jgi:hypothetical protein